MSAVLGFLIGVIAGMSPGALDSVEDPPRLVGGESAALVGRQKERRELDEDGEGTIRVGEVTIRRRIIVRIPLIVERVPLPPLGVTALPRRQLMDARMIEAPTCLALRGIRGATTSRKGVVMVTLTADRYVAGLERGCRPVDFQSGFYIDPTPDGALCAGRDLLHARSGTTCAITGFRRLRAER